MNDDINSIFQEYLVANADKELIDFAPLLQKYPQHKESLSKKIKAYQKILGTLRDETPEKETPLLVGREIGGCKLIKVLGQGGMGVVYLGRQEKLDREVVVKVLRPFAIDNKALKERFLRESRIIGRLNHKNIVPVYDVGEQDGSFYIIMRYVEGTPLNVLIENLSKTDRSTKTPTELFCDLVIQIADAVQYAHDNGVIHRDIKPSNIILDTNGNPMLLDFGLSHDDVEKKLTISGEFLGTPIYSAPESFQKQITKDSPQLDVYSLGVTLYELLTGGLPYEGDSIYEIYTNIKNKEPIRPKNKWKYIPRDLETIISTAISKDTQLRYQSVQLLRDDLQNFLNYLPIKAKAPSIIKRAFYYARRKRRSVVMAGATLFLIFVLIGGYYFEQDRKMQKIAVDAIFTASEGNLDEGIDKLKNLTTLYPDKAEYWYLLGELQSLSGNDFEAIEILNHALRIKEDIEYYETLSTAYLYSGDVESADSIIEKVLSRDPLNYDALAAKGTIDVVQHKFNSAVLTYKKISKIEERGFSENDIWDQYGAFCQSALSMVATIFKQMGYNNIAEKNIRQAMSNLPYNTSLYKIFEQLPLNERKRTKLKKILDTFKREHLQLSAHNLELTLPYGWQREAWQHTFGREVLAAYSGVPIRPMDIYLGPTILVAHLKNANDIIEEAYMFLDRTIVRHKGGTINRNVRMIKNDPIKRFIVTTDIVLPLQQLKVEALVVEKDSKVYMIMGFAPTETFAYYEKSFLKTMNSVWFSNNQEWNTYSPPYKSYNVKMPSTPFYWQRVIKTGNKEAPIKYSEHVLASDMVASMPKYYVYHFMLDLPLNEEEQKKRFSDGIEMFKKDGKILFANQVYENGMLKLKAKIKFKNNIIADTRVFFLGANAYQMKVDQDSNSYDEVSAEKFFGSFQEIGNPINVSTVFEIDTQKTRSKTKNWEDLLKEATSGNLEDQNELGKFYVNKKPRTEQDLAEALKWFRKANELGHPNAINNMGVMYQNGFGVQKDKNEAKKWYQKAVDLGFDVAQNNLGALYLADAKTPEDFEKAMQLFLSAAKKGNKNAAYKLGQIYEDGALGIPINYKEADYWYGKAFE